MLKISATMIESFRQYFEETTYFGNIVMSEEKLIRSIKGEFKGTEQTDYGTAFHEILQFPHESHARYCKYANDGSNGFMSKNGIVFPFEPISVEIYPTIDYSFPFEVKTHKIYEIKGEPVKVVAKVDQLQGYIANEHKSSWGDIYRRQNDDGEYELTSGETFDFERYYRSMQWKLYIDVFDLQSVTYKVYEWAIDKTSLTRDEKVFLGSHIINMPKYDEIGEHINDLLVEFVDFIHFMNLEQYFKDK